MKVILKLLNEEYEAVGDNAQEALNKLDVKGFTKLKSFITIQDKEKEKVIFLSPLQTNRLLSQHPVIKKVAVKQLALRIE